MLAATIALGAGGLAVSSPASAAAPMVRAAAPGYFRLMVGAFEVTALSDGTVDLPVDQLLSEKPAKTRAALTHAFLAAPLETSVNAYLVNTGDKLVLIDTGAANLFGPTLGKLIGNLKAAGYTPSQVDEIYLTHMHPDHAGGLQQDGARAFPNATVRADQREAAYWLSQTNLANAPAASKSFFEGAMGSLKPYLAAERFKPFDGMPELVPGIRATATYGHSAGHTSYLISSQGKSLLLVGDLIHVPAVQLAWPGVTIAFDSDPKAAIGARNKVFAQAAKDGVLIGASHIAFPGLGHLRSAGTGYKWVALNYTQMR